MMWHGWCFRDICLDLFHPRHGIKVCFMLPDGGNMWDTQHGSESKVGRLLQLSSASSSWSTQRGRLLLDGGCAAKWVTPWFRKRMKYEICRKLQEKENMLNLLDMSMAGALFLRDVCWLALSASLKSCRKSSETSARSLWQSPGGVGLCSHFLQQWAPVL